MKALLRCTVGAALTLSFGAAAYGQHYNQTNLVSNTSGVAPVTDPNLRNPWGLSRGSVTAWWVSDANAGVVSLYDDGAGTKKDLVVTVPPADSQRPVLHSSCTLFAKTANSVHGFVIKLSY
jgi:hypothetical protein